MCTCQFNSLAMMEDVRCMLEAVVFTSLARAMPGTEAFLFEASQGRWGSRLAEGNKRPRNKSWSLLSGRKGVCSGQSFSFHRFHVGFSLGTDIGHTQQPGFIVITIDRAGGVVVRGILHHGKHTKVDGAASHHVITDVLLKPVLLYCSLCCVRLHLILFT